MTRVVGIVLVVFFGLCSAYAIGRLFDKAPGLILNSEGIIDNSSAVSAGFIAWKQVTHLSAGGVRSQRLLTIHVRDPGQFMDRGGLLKRLGRRVSCMFYDGPIQISAICLETDFDSLVAAVKQFHAKSVAE